VDEGYLVGDVVRIWTLRRPTSLSYFMDSYPIGDRRTVPAEERAAALASVENYRVAGD